MLCSCRACWPPGGLPACAGDGSAAAEPEPAWRCLHAGGDCKRAAVSPGVPIAGGRSDPETLIVHLCPRESCRSSFDCMETEPMR